MASTHSSSPIHSPQARKSAALRRQGRARTHQRIESLAHRLVAGKPNMRSAPMLQ